MQTVKGEIIKIDVQLAEIRLLILVVACKKGICFGIIRFAGFQNIGGPEQIVLSVVDLFRFHALEDHTDRVHVGSL